MQTVYIVHSDWFEKSGYRDDITYVYNSQTNARNRIDKLVKDFRTSNDFQDANTDIYNEVSSFYVYEDKDCIYEIYYTIEEVLDTDDE